jgi:tetratricopeptide (TPR) repeat protein
MHDHSRKIQWFILYHLKGATISLLIIFTVLIAGFSGCESGNKPSLTNQQKRQLANALYNQQLYQQAVNEYTDYLQNYPLDSKEQASISYMIANIYFERLHDYENALAYYLRIKQLYPESSVQAEATKKMVECLERLRRSTDAQQVVEQTSALDEAQKPVVRPGEVIARIGQREITTSDLQFEMNRLPVYIQDQIKSRQQKIDFLKNYIAQELLYDSAKRKGLDKDKEVREGLVLAEKSLMTQKLLQEEIDKTVDPQKYSNADVELFYKANSDRYAEKDEQGKVIRIPSFTEVKEKVAQDFIQEKQEQAYQQLIERLMKAEDVQIYEQKFQ